jgi:hypothetical protein
MKRSVLIAILISATAWGPKANAQFVDDNVTSDSYFNTGRGVAPLLETDFSSG